MFKYVVEGGYPIRGTVRASGNKNAALPCIAATLLTDEPVLLSNVPDIEDVQVMLRILGRLGSTVQRREHGEFQITTSNITTSALPVD